MQRSKAASALLWLVISLSVVASLMMALFTMSNWVQFNSYAGQGYKALVYCWMLVPAANVIFYRAALPTRLLAAFVILAVQIGVVVFY
jgi:hypothetical protein